MRVFALDNLYSRGHGEEDTPVPIPNTVVKLLSGGSTWWVTAWEICTSRGYISFERPFYGRAFLFYHVQSAHVSTFHLVKLTMALATGTIAPAFTLRTMKAEGLEDVSLADHLGKDVVVLLFFPAAFTGVCTQEFCDMTAGLGGYADLGAVVYGISCDTAFSHAEWAKKNNIGITLLSDFSKSTTQAYDVVLSDLVGMGPASKRAAFVIDREGIIRYSEETPTPLDLPNFEAVKATLQSLNSVSA